MRQLRILIGFFAAGMLLLTGCNQEESLIPESKGRINVHLTDSPFPMGLVNSTVVTIDRVEIRQRLEVEPGNEETSFITIAEGEMQFDLLTLTNGISEKIASADLDPGTYDLIRLHVVDAKILLNDGTEFDLKIPSGSASGLKVKIEPAVVLQEGQTSDILLDFDVSKSFVAKGNIKAGHIIGFNFKPVVRGVYLGAAGRIEGKVTDADGNPVENAWVKVLLPGTAEVGEEEAEDQVLMSSYTDADGNFKLIGIPAATYAVSCELEEFAKVTVEGVEVKTGSSTRVDFVMIKD